MEAAAAAAGSDKVAAHATVLEWKVPRALAGQSMGNVAARGIRELAPAAWREASPSRARPGIMQPRIAASCLAAAHAGKVRPPCLCHPLRHTAGTGVQPRLCLPD